MPADRFAVTFAVPDTKDLTRTVWNKHAMRDLIASLSLANLLYLHSWALLFASHKGGYSFRTDPLPLQYLAAMLAVLVLGGVLFTFFRWLRFLRSHPKSGTLIPRLAAGIGLILIWCMLVMRTLIWIENTVPGASVFTQARVVSVSRFLLIGIGFLLFAAHMAGWGSPLRIAGFGLLLISPLVLINFARAIGYMTAYNPARLANHATSPPLAVPASAPHVVWFIFDEWDQSLAFDERPADLKLPELDRLRAESFYAGHVWAPGPRTDISMPSLILGKRVLNLEERGASDAILQLDGEQSPVAWSAQPNVFSQARDLGYNTGILSWAIPYCRVISSSLTGCEWLTDQDHAGNASLPHLLMDQFRLLFETDYRSPLGQLVATRDHAWLYHQLVPKAEKILETLPYNLALLHMPVPHLPFFYNAKSGRDDYGVTPIVSLRISSGVNGYPNMLALVDRTIGEFRRKMEAAGTWRTTTILFSADHPFRKRYLLDGKPRSLYVPFILKLADQTTGFQCDAAFNGLLTRDLLLAILRKELRNSSEVNQWILRHQGQYPLVKY